jgi:hypothetical protein
LSSLPHSPNKATKSARMLLTHLAKRHRVHVACFTTTRRFRICRHGPRHRRGECLFVPLNAATKWFVPLWRLKGHPITTAISEVPRSSNGLRT